VDAVDIIEVEARGDEGSRAVTAFGDFFKIDFGLEGVSGAT
jgi:hypothetical protein